ncbi:MAG: hypothetical protein NT068_01030 [Candidatus Nomurabacteria bacterium]|nr:hypothetical protein [Candidatus Nomurabacteria bacterium]
MSEENQKISIGDYDTIMNDRNIFNQIVYTPLSEALRLLEERQKDPVLMAKIEELLNGDIPEVLKPIGKYAVQFRQIATPNNECKYFLKISNNFGLTPTLMEYHSDKFSSNNFFKRSLGQLHIQGPINKKNEYQIEKITIMDFNKHNGKKLNEVVTHWNESIIDFHRKLFNICDLNTKECNFYDTSEWINNHGSSPEEYYKQFLILFVCHGILFENFLLNKEESSFIKNVILPALEDVINLTGVKPLIVPGSPIDIEDENFWVLYHPNIKTIIQNEK